MFYKKWEKFHQPQNEKVSWLNIWSNKRFSKMIDWAQNMPVPACFASIQNKWVK